MIIFLLTIVALYGPWIAGGLFTISTGLIVSVFIDTNRIRRSIVLLFLFALLFAELILVMQLQLGSIVNMILLFWVIFHLWLMGKFDR